MAHGDLRRGLSLTRVWHQMLFSHGPVTFNELADMFISFFVLELLALLTLLLGQQSRKLRQRVRTLEGLLPICSFCKSIRNEQEEWVQLENFMARHSGAVFSHGLCPGCAKTHYGDFYPPRKQS